MLVTAHGVANAARDAKLAGSAQVARAQDLTAAAHTLARTASRSVDAFAELQLESASEPAHEGPDVPVLAIPLPTIA
jgi:hypothetical protein